MQYKKNNITRVAVLFVWVVVILGSLTTDMFAEPNITDYTATPIILSSSSEPNVLIIQDNSGSMDNQAYSGTYSASNTYDGLFKSSKKYKDTGSYYEEDATGSSSGNRLNFDNMRRIDINKWVLTGGPYEYGGFDKDGKPIHLVVTRNGKKIRVSDKPHGIIQDMGTRVRFGLEIFNNPENPDNCTNNGSNGGEVTVPININPNADQTTIINTIVTNVNAIIPSTWTPLAESVLTAVGYFAQSTTVDVNNGPMYHSGDYVTSNSDYDPYAGGQADCVKSYVILITDGEATRDSRVSASYRTWPNNGTTDPTQGGTEACSQGSHNYQLPNDYLDNVAYWAHINNVRSSVAGSKLTFFTVYTFGDGSGTQILQSAAKWGGFVDRNNNNKPDSKGQNGATVSEWDSKNTGTPDNYFEASSGEALKTALQEALSTILGQTSSGTALSLLSTNTKAGEATAIQAYYRPSISNSTLTWAGYLQGYWLDDQYNLREDTNDNKRLDLTEDNIITFFLDANNDTKVHRIPVSGTSPYGDINSMTTIDLSGTSPLWDGGEKLHQRSAADRKIFTVIGGTAGSYDTGTNAVSGSVKRFNTTNASSIQPYLGIADDDTWKDLGDTATNRTTNLINWISGDETIVSGSNPDMRSRAINGDVWKLGDIIDANPVAVGDPQQQYDVLYSDLTYTEFRQFIQAKQRETIVYTGANDGMLHAFTTWRYNSGTTIFEKRVGTSELLGDELWAYIPQALLPHLKWLADKNYKHVYYVDLTPVIMDVRIFDEDAATHPKGWGTILIGGFNWGGKHIQATGDFGSGTETRDFYPSYFCLDITDPRKPRVLWERTYDNLGLTTSSPSILRITDASGKNGNTWFAAFGSGPANYTDTAVTLDQSARIFVINPLDGIPYRNSGNDWLKDCTLGKKGYMNSPVSFDKFLDYNVDAIYFGETYNDSSSDSNPSWKGKIWKLSIPGIPPLKENEPTNWNHQEMLDFDAPITGSVSIGVGYHNTPYVFFGTGRYMEQKDKGYIAAQYLVGLVDHEDTIIRNFNDFTFPGNGWYYSLVGTGERSLTKPAVYAGAAVFTTFIPSSDICGFGGNGNLYLNDFFNGNLLTHVDLGVGNPSPPIIRPTSSGGRTHIDILGLPPGTGDNTGTAIAQSSTGVILNIPNLPFPKISRNKFTYWREP